MALTLVEATMQDGFGVQLEFDVYTEFPNCPMESYVELVQIVLTKLQLFEILDSEMNYLKSLSINLHNDENFNRSTTVTSKNINKPDRKCNSVDTSKYFKAKDIDNMDKEENTNKVASIKKSINLEPYKYKTSSKHDRSHSSNNQSAVESMCNIKNSKSNNKRKNENFENRKVRKVKDNSNHILEDIKLIQKIPSLKDVFNVDFDDSNEENFEITLNNMDNQSNNGNNDSQTNDHAYQSQNIILLNDKLSQNSKSGQLKDFFSFKSKQNDSTLIQNKCTDSEERITKTDVAQTINSGIQKSSVSNSSSQKSNIFNSQDEDYDALVFD